MKVDQLSGAALDWAVAGCSNEPTFIGDGRCYQWTKTGKPVLYSPSTDWAIGGPIIETKRIRIEWAGDEGWRSSVGYGVPVPYACFGPTPLVAAMRIFVTVTLGDEVHIPEGVK